MRHQQRQRTGDPVRPCEVTGAQRLPQRGLRPHGFTGRHGTHHTPPEAVDEVQAAGALEDAGPAAGGVEQRGHPGTDRRRFGFEHHPVAVLGVKARLQ